MVATAAPITIGTKAQENLLSFCKSTQLSTFNPQNIDLRARFKYIDIEYIRENRMAIDQAVQSAIANRGGDKRKIQDMVIPVVEPQVESSLAYLTSVFLTGMPIFGIVSGPDNEDEAEQIEAVVSENSMTGGWPREFMMFFRDGLKYNFSAIECDWCTKKVYTLETDVKQGIGANATAKEIQWQGNTIKRCDPYNTLFDPRIKLTEQHIKAEFVGHVELHNRVSLTQYLQSLPYRMNYTKALQSTMQLNSGIMQLYYIPEIFTENLSPTTKTMGLVNWDVWANGGKLGANGMNYKNLYQLVTRYVRIVPKDFELNVPANGQVQIWKIVTVNDAEIVYIERLSNAHNYLPIIFGQPIEDGLNLQTKSFAQKQIPLQDIASSLVNARFAARRRAITDRGLYDPSRIDPKHMESDSPTAKIPVRPNAYGQDLSKAYYAIPFKDEQTGGIMGDVHEVMNFSNLLSGQNNAQQGQFVKGNKTRSEYEDVQNRASGRQQTMALCLEYQVMVPAKKIILYNVLQYQPSGEVYSYAEKKPVNVNPIDLRKKAYQFKVSDGLTPSSKLMGGEMLQSAMQIVGTSQELNEEYSVGGIFSALMHLGGLDIDAFKRDQANIDQRHQQQIALEQAKRTPVQGQPQGQPNAANI